MYISMYRCADPPGASSSSIEWQVEQKHDALTSDLHTIRTNRDRWYISNEARLVEIMSF
jgi:hypothetical protein